MSASAARTSLALRALDYRFEVVSTDDDLIARVAEVYRDLRADGGDSDEPISRYELVPGKEEGMCRLLCDGGPVVGEVTPSDVLGYLIWHVNAQATTRRQMPDHVLLHAAAATRSGRAVVLAAPMESGKTTTVSGLVRAGWGYLTDEAAAVRLDDLHVEPWHKSLAVDDGSWAVLPELAEHDAGGIPTQWQVPVSRIPGAQLADRTPIGWVVLPRYVKGASTSLDAVSPASALVELAASTFQFREAPVRHLDALADLVRAVDSYRLTVGSLDEAVETLTRMTETP